MSTLMLRLFISCFVMLPVCGKGTVKNATYHPDAVDTVHLNSNSSYPWQEDGMPRRGTVDTIRISSSSNYLYFSESVMGISHIHFLGKGMQCIDPASFQKESTKDRVKDSIELSPEKILNKLQGLHPLPSGPSEPFKINNLLWLKAPAFRADTSLYHTNAVIFDTYFEDAAITVDEEKEQLILDRYTRYIPEGFAGFACVYLRDQPYIIAQYNIEGTLYTEWFRFGCESENPIYRALRYTAQGIETGAKHAVRGFNIGKEKAIQGAETGIEKTVQGLEKAKQGLETGATHAERGAEIGATHAAHGIESGLDGGMTGVGKAVFNESKMFYRPSRIMEDMHPLVYDEKAIEVEKGITIYTYFFKSRSPKANIFLIHGNGGNVSTYKKMIHTLVEARYNVYVVDWRGYGKSKGKPEYKGVLKDTEAAFDDFLSQTQSDTLKTIVYGMSLGGQIATKLVRDRQPSVDALILEGSISSAQNMAIDFMPGEFIRNNIQKNVDMFNQEYVAETDIQHINKLPKLIIHSRTDNVVPFYHGEKLYENALKPKRFWKTDTHHIRTLEEQPDEAIRRIDALLRLAQK